MATSSPPAPRTIPWTDDPRPLWSSKVARTFKVHVVPPHGAATEIVLEGRCPRCHHDFVSTHPVRAVMSGDQARALAASNKAEFVPEDIAAMPPGTYGLRRVTGECCCTHTHADAPEGRAGCGAPFAIWVSWAPHPEQTETERPSLCWSAGPAEPLALEEERQLRASAATQLADVRKAAESWRTGLGGFLAILVAVFFVKGKDSFGDIDSELLKRWLAGLLLAAGTFALYGAYRALRAAYGTPRDEYLGEISRLFRLLHPTTPRDIYKYGTVSAWHHASARTAVNDLRHAKVATVLAMVAFGAAAAITWFAPGPPAPAFVSATYRTGGGTTTTCGRATDSPAGTLWIKPTSGRVQRITLKDAESVKVVASCP